MTKTSSGSDDRRELPRTRATLVARCITEHASMRARIFEVNHSGMTLICDPSFPDITGFSVVCRLKNAREFTFKVRIRNRQSLERAHTQILRLGLAILNPMEWMDDFLCELALQRMRDLKMAKSRLDALQENSLSSHFGRGFQRLAFQLPAIAKVNEETFRCRTLDVSTGGLRLWAPEIFPVVSVFILSYEVPDGKSIRLTAGIRNRKQDPGGGWQLGLRVMSGNRQFGAFLQKFRIWKSPEA